jgi:hypothetical protein
VIPQAAAAAAELRIVRWLLLAWVRVQPRILKPRQKVDGAQLLTPNHPAGAPLLLLLLSRLQYVPTAHDAVKVPTHNLAILGT